MITRKKILSFFNYSKENGTLIWKDHWCKSTKTRFIGQVAGVTTQKNYRQVVIEYKIYLVHRLIWFLEKRQWPRFIDHIDGNGLNNKIENLRSVSSRMNQHNLHFHRKGKLVGTTFEKKSGRWISQLYFKGKYKKLGRFSTELEAHNCYMNFVRVNRCLS